ncbi:hypothetical protein BT63DRAFT_427953 [Microthyrium microscopicum]|uniref:Uncharacterized protein n=1 Tax=Microthyrium microscopicum TaxID=703497 RepID=A0A6A6U3A5_9PEZI|nr:hypothetical protein BT63DRAFT_427953 [Microthyrium microscopicum]
MANSTSSQIWGNKTSSGIRGAHQSCASRFFAASPIFAQFSHPLATIGVQIQYQGSQDHGNQHIITKPRDLIAWSH